MLCLSKRIDYALLALAYLAERGSSVASAREIAEANDLPLPLLMKILKRLHQQGVVAGTRGVKGGYRLVRDTDTLSLHDLIVMVEDGDPMHRDHRHGPVQALQYRLVGFLRDVTLSDLVIPGRRIDVPLERIRKNEPKLASHATAQNEPKLASHATAQNEPKLVTSF